jgi:DNA-binding transcriptional ArsR family regulator
MKRSTVSHVAAEPQPNLTDCNCLAVRQAARYVTQLYDRHLARSGLRTSQYGILARLQRRGPMTINELAAELVMDRTTLGRNIRPLERDGLITITPGRADRRLKELRADRGRRCTLSRGPAGVGRGPAQLRDRVRPRALGRAAPHAARARRQRVVTERRIAVTRRA